MEGVSGRCDICRVGPRLITLEELVCHREIGLRANRGDVIHHDGLSEARCFCQADISRNDGLENPLSKVLARIGGHLAREVKSSVVHCEQHTIDMQRGVDRFLYSLDGSNQLGNSLKGEVLALERNKDGVSRDEHVESNQRQRGRAIDQYVVVSIANRGQDTLHPQYALGIVNQFHFGAGEIGRGGHDIQVPELDSTDESVVEVGIPYEDIIGRSGESLAREAISACRIALRISVNEKNALFGDGEGRREVHSSRGLSNPTLLVGDSENAAHGWSSMRGRRTRQECGCEVVDPKYTSDDSA